MIINDIMRQLLKYLKAITSRLIHKIKNNNHLAKTNTAFVNQMYLLHFGRFLIKVMV